MRYKAQMRFINKWVKGRLINKEYLKSCIQDEVEGVRAVKAHTICKNTYLKDKEGRYIFEHDIIVKDKRKGHIFFSKGIPYIKWYRGPLELLKDKEVIVCGNRFEK